MNNPSFYLIAAIIMIITITTIQQLAYSSNNSTNSDQKFSYFDKDINAVIGEGLQECSGLKNDSCIAVMSTLNEVCRVAYFPNCFGESWTPFMNHLEKMKKEGHIQREDPYLTLNNEHFGNDSIQWEDLKK